MEVAVFQRSFLGIEGVLGMAPRVIRSKAPAVGSGNRNSGSRRPSRRVNDGELDPAYGFLVGALLHGNSSRLAAGDFNDSECGVPALIRDVGDARSIGRPAGGGGVTGFIRELERVATVAGHEPELVPLTSEIGAIHHALTVPAPVGASLPGGLLVTKLVRLGTGVRGHAPETAGSPDVPPIGDEDQLP